MSVRSDRIMGWARPAVRDMKPYYKAPLDGDPLRLDQNTNLWGPNPVLDGLKSPPVDQYPTRDTDGLLAALADWHGVSADHFVVGNGSDEVLDLLTKAFTAPGQTLASPAPSYSLYPFYASLQELTFVEVPLKGGFRLDVDDLLAVKADLTVIASPNNPTGNRVPSEDLERIIKETDGVVVIDEAYIEYAGLKHSFLPRVDEFDNLCVMRTFSKAYGLAGLRIGYLGANPDIIGRLRLVKPPFNLNTHSEAAAIAALDEQGWVDDVVTGTLTERERMATGLKNRGLRVHPSDANFLLCDAPDDPGLLAAALRKQGILARTFPGAGGLEHAIRFTVGMPEHTDQLFAALDTIGGDA